MPLERNLELSVKLIFLPGGRINFCQVQKNVNRNEEKSKMLNK